MSGYVPYTRPYPPDELRDDIARLKTLVSSPPAAIQDPTFYVSRVEYGLLLARVTALEAALLAVKKPAPKRRKRR